MNERKRSSGTFGRMKRWLTSKLQEVPSTEHSQDSQDSYRSPGSPQITISCDREVGPLVVTLETPNNCHGMSVMAMAQTDPASERYGRTQQSMNISRSLPSSSSSSWQHLTSILVGEDVHHQQNSDDDTPTCPTCKQHIPTRSVEDIGTKAMTPYNAVKEQKGKYDQAFLKVQQNRSRNASVRSDEIQMTDRTSRMIKAASNTPVQRSRLSLDMGKPARSGFGCRNSDRSSTLIRPCDINTGKFRITKKGSNMSKTSTRACKDMSKNQSDTEDESDPITTSIFSYSPEVTPKAPILVNGQPVDEFKYILESNNFKIPSIYGQIKIMFQYFNNDSQFVVTVLKGARIAPRKTGRLGLYTKVCLVPGKLQQKRGTSKHDSHDPVFYEHFNFHTSLDALLDVRLRIKLYNKPGIFSVPEPVGVCEVPLFYYDLTAVTVIWLNLKKTEKQKDELDEFDFSIFDHQQSSPPGCNGLLCGLKK